MVDAFSNVNDLTSQGRKLVLLTSSDASDLTDVPKALLVTVGGNISIDPVDQGVSTIGSSSAGNTAVVLAVTAGQVFDAVRIRRLRATGTTATVYGIY